MTPAIAQIAVSAFEVPTDGPESDGTLEWNSTIVVVVRAQAGNQTGLGYTYADRSTAVLIQEKLAKWVDHQDALDVTGNWERMMRGIRNLGRCGIAMMAVSAVDLALWDLKGRLLQQPVARLIGALRSGVPAYGSGGFTSYSVAELQAQLGGWARDGLKSVKMKIGREPDQDEERVRQARNALGGGVALYVDANGAYGRREALRHAQVFIEEGVTWFEEPVSSDDLDGLRLIREHGPSSIEVVAGEYGYDLPYFRNMLKAEAVDVLQADITRCGGITGFLRVGTLCEAHQVPLSAHTAPSAHVHPCCALSGVRNIEYFHDHARIERMFFDGAAAPVNGELRPDLGRPGLGLDFKEADAQRYAL